MARHVARLHPVVSTPTAFEQAEWLSAERDMLLALRDFPTDAAFPGVQEFIDLQEFVQLGTNCSERFTRDTMLIMDPGDSRSLRDCLGEDDDRIGDIYRNNAAGASALAGRPLAIVYDVGGNELYFPDTTTGRYDCQSTGVQTNNVSIGSGATGGVGILVDHGGNDTYAGASCSEGSGQGGAGYLLDEFGNDIYRTVPVPPFPGLAGTPPYASIGVGVEGFGFAYDGSPLAASQTDNYLAYGDLSIGAGNAGVGIVIGGQGVSNYTATCHDGLSFCNGGGESIGYADGSGIGAVIDRAGRDSFTCEHAAGRVCIGSVQGGLVVPNPAALTVGGLGLVVNDDTLNPLIPGATTNTFTLGAGVKGGFGYAEGYPTDIGADFAGLIDIQPATCCKDTYVCASPTMCLGAGDAFGEGFLLDTGGAADVYPVPSSVNPPLYSTRGLQPGGQNRRDNLTVWVGNYPLIWGAGVDSA